MAYKTGFDEQKFTDILVEQNVITQEEKIALHKEFDQYDGDEIIDFLIDEDLVQESDIVQALSEYYQVPGIDVLGYFFYHDLLTMFPKSFLLRNRIIPLTVDENIMIMVAANPSDPDLLVKIGEHVSYDIQFYVGIARDISDSVKEFYDISDTDIDEDAESRIGLDDHDEQELVFELYDDEDLDYWDED